ncbi:TlpA family protein disulfide reductase [Pedobacter hartonius]|uniref:Thiol-disulfide isomerase or thioredoxin n=1 Tax=Pedobacter hartonius TaxID=425514 RepID=A0A1H4G7H3_9SPHI|nr:TlpA disulfide reductase family protein [Pedobacter hartonius]SEB04980.1 Thiol-disulfide isomerase or thioredoxin [Pedobacter hartonius]
MMKHVINAVIIMILINLSTQVTMAKEILADKKNVTIQVDLDSLIKDKPFMIVYEKGVNEYDASKVGQVRVPAKSAKAGSFVFELKDQKKPLYFSIMFTQGMNDLPMVERYFFEPGDQIRILVKKADYPVNYRLDFSGIGSAKYSCQNGYKQVYLPTSKEWPEVNFADATERIISRDLRSLYLMRKLIERYQPEMSAYSYHLLNADVVGKLGSQIMDILGFHLVKLVYNKDTVGLKKYEKNLADIFKFDFAKDIPDSVLYDSKVYAEFILAKLSCESMMSTGQLGASALYPYVKDLNNGRFKDKILMSYFMRYWKTINDKYQEILNDAILNVKDPYCLTRIKEFDRHSAGYKAYNFSLRDVNGKTVTLRDFKGKVVFIDFWFTGCVHCKHYYQGVLDSVENVYKRNPKVVFITICADKKKEQWISSVKSGEYTSPKAVNLYTNGDGFENDMIKYYNITGYPSPMLIDHLGNIIKFSGTGLRHENELIKEIDNALKNIQ